MASCRLIFLLCCSVMFNGAFAQSSGSVEQHALGTLDDLIRDAGRVVISDQPFELSPDFKIIGENRVPVYELADKNKGKPSRYFYTVEGNKRLISKIQILKKFPSSYYNDNDEPN